jgi:hypothetical protein
LRGQGGQEGMGEPPGRAGSTSPPPTPPQPGDAPRSPEERLAHHCAFVTVRTPAVDTIARQVRTLMLLGRHQQTTARPSLTVTAPAAA